MTEQKKIQPGSIETHDIPTIYVNHAQLTMSYHELRIYLSEASPKKITLGNAKIPTETSIIPKASILMTPEFGKALLDAIKSSVDQYETQFGQIRKKPNERPPKP